MQIEILSNQHNRSVFNCGDAALNDYIQKYALQDIKRNIGRTFVVVQEDAQEIILGFYTICAGSINFENLSPNLKKLPRYPIPITRIGRLAVDISMQGKGIGEYLLMDGLHRSMGLADAQLGIFGVVVDAKHEKAKRFYNKYGFIELTNSPLTLIITIQQIRNRIK